MRVAKQDNQHFALKVALRDRVLAEAASPTLRVCESHGGLGRLYGACYRQAAMGLVVEHESHRVDALVRQRPTWRVYEGDAGKVFAAGLGADVAWTMLDCDPYGAPWETLDGFFSSQRAFAPCMAVAATDGSRQKHRLGGRIFGWEPWQERYGKGLWTLYLRCCQERFVQVSAQAGYVLTWWHGRYGGQSGQMTYWAAVLRQPEDRCSDAVQPGLPE
jgi:hypothetical protein